MAQNPYASIAVQDEANPYTSIAVKPPAPQPPPTMAQRAIGFGEDLGKGVLESVGGMADTIGAPVGYAAKKLGLVNETPEQRKQQEQLFKPVNATQAVGAGAGDALQAMIPVEKALPLIGKAGGVVGDAIRPIANKITELNQAWNPLPLRSRAVNAFKTIENAAKDVPVDMQKTEPAVSGYLQHLSTGGESSGPVMNRLAERLGRIPEEGPVLYPEARQFSKNIGRESEKPGFLKRAFEPRGMADTRRVVGGAGQALKTDIGSAAETIGRGQDLSNAMNEYRQNANLRTLGKVFAGIAAEETARRTGLLGKVARRVIGQ